MDDSRVERWRQCRAGAAADERDNLVTVGEQTQRWTIGDVTITAIIEAETPGIPPEFFFPASTAADVAAEQWAHGPWAAADGTISLRVQSFVLELDNRTVLVDPCVGNHKTRVLPFWNDQSFPWLERFRAAGFTPEAVDLVVHTHLHADHVGWDAQLIDGGWQPTFVNARHVYVDQELAYWREPEHRFPDDVFPDSIDPIFDAGLADVVDASADLDARLRLVPSPGHTPGHASLAFGQGRDAVIISGDLMHSPVQFARPEWAEIGDTDASLSEATRREFCARHCADETFVLGTHFPTEPAGRVRAADVNWRFDPVPAHA